MLICKSSQLFAVIKGRFTFWDKRDQFYGKELSYLARQGHAPVISQLGGDVSQKDPHKEASKACKSYCSVE